MVAQGTVSNPGDISGFSTQVVGYANIDGPEARLQLSKSGSIGAFWFYNYDATSKFPGDINIGYDTILSVPSTSGSLNIRNGNINLSGSINVTGSLTASLREGYVWVGDNTGKNTLQIATSSFGGGIATLPNGVISSSQQITNFGFISSSVDITLLNQFSGSLNTYTGSNDSVRNRILQTTASLNTYTGSNDSVIARILQATASLNTTTGSLIGITNGLMALTASMKAAAIVSSSTQIQNYFLFAQTSSANTFYNNQTISGSLFVSSTAISNATLLANSSNLTLSSGSNLYIYNGGFADISGSLRLTGSLSVGFSAGTSEFQVLSTGVNIGNISTDRHLITGSLIVSASTNLTGSVTINESRIDTAWTAYTPQWTAASSNPAIGNGTIEGYYKVIGKTCFVRGNIAMGSTTTFGTGEWYVSMPFTASHADAILMTVTLLDNGSNWYNATMAGARAGFNHKAPMQYQNVAGTASDVNATGPFTWATSDRFIWNGSYEIA
jgi:hypothetical protein